MLGLTRPLFLLIFILAGLNVYAQKLIFKKRGKEIKVLSLEEIKKKVPPVTIKVIEPHINAERSYQAFPINQLLSLPEIYDKSWKFTEEMVLTCLDGYAPSIPVEEFINYTAYLAFAPVPGEKFSIENIGQNEKNVSLGPFYLVWDNIKHMEIKDEGASFWPYQVESIDLVSFSDKFPKLAPKKEASTEVKKGFLAFRRYCLSCHTIHQEGGGKAPDLTQATKTHKKDWLKKFIDNPRSLRPESKMVQFNLNHRSREKTIDHIIEFLEAKATD